METIAVYWEPKIRIYGLTTEGGVSLYSLLFPAARLPFWSGVIRNLEDKGREFLLVNLQASPPASMQLSLILRPGIETYPIRDVLLQKVEEEKDTSFEVIAGIELLYLHGPHFQDRYGIIEAVLTPLQKAGIPLLCAGCAGTSVYCAVSEHSGKDAAKCLAETFVL
jgi:aspartokinase